MIHELDKVKELFETLLPKKALSKTELRRALFEATSLAFRLLVAPAGIQYSDRVKERMTHIDHENLLKLEDLAFAKSLAKYRDEKLLSTVGFHVVDPEIGRYSQIWIPPSRLCTQKNQASSTPPPKKNNDSWWKEYPDIWLRVYKQFLHPSTSLINAYERQLLKFPATPLLIKWDDSDEKIFKDHATIVSLRHSDAALTEFVKQTQETLQILHEILLSYSTGKLAGKSELLIVEKIKNQLYGEKVNDKLALSRDKYLVAVLEPGQHRKIFLSLLNGLSAKDGKILSQLSSESGTWYRKNRYAAVEGIEILQTILFNAPGFCDDLGLLIDHEQFDQSNIYLILGRDIQYKLNPTSFSHLVKIFRIIKSAFSSILKDPIHVKILPRPSWERSNTVDDVLRYMGLPQNPESGEYGFLTFAMKLSHEAIHEGRELNFLLGFGHAEEPDVRCRKPIPIPRHLSKEGVDLDLLVHFVKSYFSFFGREDKLLWFDQNGRCCGVFERAPQDPKKDWLEGWREDCCFVRITGQDEFDVIMLEESVLTKSRHRPRIRVKGENVIDLKSTSDIKFRAFAAAAQVFESSADLAYQISELVAKIADHLREDGHGAGIVIANINETNQGIWRSSIKEQEKRLVPKLHDKEDPEGEEIHLDRLHYDRENDMESLVKDICLLAELDGAVYLRFEGSSMRLAPARHFFPLLSEGDAKKNEPNRALQNFHKWAEEGLNIFKNSPEKANDLRKFLDIWREAINNININNLKPNMFQKAFDRCKDKLHPFEDPDLLKLYTACIRGLPELESNDVIRTACAELAFLNSSGTRHHSLWGITVSSKERLFVVSISQDGRASVFWDGRLIPSH